MANTKSAKKAFRSSEKKNIVNTARVNRIRSFIKKVDGAIKVGDETKAYKTQHRFTQAFSTFNRDS